MALLRIGSFITTWRSLSGQDQLDLEKKAVSLSEDKPAFGSYHYLEETALVREYYASLTPSIEIDGFEAVPAYLDVEGVTNPSVFNVLLPIVGKLGSPKSYFGQGRIVIVQCGKLDHHKYPSGYKIETDNLGKHIIRSDKNVREAIDGKDEYS